MSAKMRFDVVVLGASFAGLAMAASLRHAFGSNLNIAIIDRAPARAHDPNKPDARAFAIAAGSKRLLATLGVWPAVEAESQPVNEIEITDSSLDAGIRPTLLTYDNHVNGEEPATHIVPARALETALAEKVMADSNLEELRPETILSSNSHETHIELGLSSDRSLSASLLIGADGRNSEARTSADIRALNWSYDQTAIVTTIAHSRTHDGKAIQHFLPGGPFALLPLPDNRCCVTWSEQASEADRILKLDENGFLAELEQRVGGTLGTISVVGPRQSWPLSLTLARDYVKPRTALIGDAAHGVHPIAGQGLNLALRDIAALTDVIFDAARIGLDIGSLSTLKRYERWRRFDSVLSAAAYHGLNKAFSNDDTILRALRDAGLSTVDRIPALKAFFVNESAGLNGELPRLFADEPF